jgi:hydroxyethylthiazole kinase
MITVGTTWSDVQQVRERRPLVHNITNYVVMNSTANALLAVGAAPVMAHAVQEVEDLAATASALVINVGTLSQQWVDAMILAMRAARRRGIPIVLDPVGAGATRYRTRTVHELISMTAPTVLRGNASEIMAVATASRTTKGAGERQRAGGRGTRGVDSTETADAALQAARALHKRYGAVVAITGEIDYVVGDDVVRITGGHPLMARVTGTGCTASALCGAFAAVNGSTLAATAHALAALGAAGAIAGERARGPGTMQLHLYDELYALTREQIAGHVTIDAV